MPLATGVNYHKKTATRISCQKCNDERVQFLMKKDLEACSACNQSLCSQCFGAHKNQCYYDHLPEERKVQLKEESQRALEILAKSKPQF